MSTHVEEKRTVDEQHKSDTSWTAEDLTWTVEDLFRSIVRGSGFPDDWFFWPPDVFALTSLIFQRTGCYRCVSSKNWPLDPQWEADIEGAARVWLEQVSSVLAKDHPPVDLSADLSTFIKDENLCKAVDAFKTLAPQVTVDQLQVLSGWDERDRPATDENRRKAQDLCEALIRMHAVADEACSDFGFPASPRGEIALVHCLANLLLTTWGSLSTIPKHHGVVLPKLRTPQKGLTLRSFSHHVTFHSSEVEVMWRATPWASMEENTINILCVPWPSEVNETHFCCEPETFEVVRYFRYEPPHRDSAYLDQVVDLVKRVEGRGRGRRIHAVVFPESALSDEEYRKLLQRLEKEHRTTDEGKKELGHVPLVLAGVRNYREEEHLNEVRLAAFFAGRWYDLSQRKHHRWRVDRSQIRQYQLEGRFATARDWYERIPVSQRRLTVLAPNNWMALCPLICEDLARLEPVSELIRGIGPTLLVALLLDGPQLKQRWSARYASVFADDPGTAVLSLTSIGMATRSRRLEAPAAAETPCRTVGLWRDQITGWQSIDLGEGQDAILLTISADWTAEYTADGRGDYRNAAVFKFEGTRDYALPMPPTAHSGWPAVRKHLMGPLRRSNREPETDDLFGRWADIREITAITYTLDAAIQKKGKDLDKLFALLLGETKPWRESRLPRQLSHLIDLICEAERKPSNAGVDAHQDEWPTEFLREAVVVMEEWLSDYANRATTTADYWNSLTDKAENQLKGVDAEIHQHRRRARRSLSIAVLAALYNRVEKSTTIQLRQHGDVEEVRRLSSNGSLTNSEAADLLGKLAALLTKYG